MKLVWKAAVCYVHDKLHLQSEISTHDISLSSTRFKNPSKINWTMEMVHLYYLRNQIEQNKDLFLQVKLTVISILFTPNFISFTFLCSMIPVFLASNLEFWVCLYSLLVSFKLLATCKSCHLKASLWNDIPVTYKHKGKMPGYSNGICLLFIN